MFYLKKGYPYTSNAVFMMKRTPVGISNILQHITWCILQLIYVKIWNKKLTNYDLYSL